MKPAYVKSIRKLRVQILLNVNVQLAKNVALNKTKWTVNVAEFEVLSTVTMKATIFRNMMSCSVLNLTEFLGDRTDSIFKGEDWAKQTISKKKAAAGCSLETLSASETPVSFY